MSATYSVEKFLREFRRNNSASIYGEILTPHCNQFEHSGFAQFTSIHNYHPLSGTLILKLP